MNLLSLFQDQIGSTLVDQASSFLGEDKSKTSSAMSAILPSLMGSLISKGSSADGAAGLLNMITSGGHDGSMLDNLTGMFSGGDNTNNLMSSGGSLLSGLLGDNLGKMVSSIAGFSGMSEGSSSSLMKMAAPLLMSLVGKQVASKGLNATGLMSLLSSQKEHVSSAMPSGLSGLGSLLGFADGLKDSVSGAGSKLVDTGAKVVNSGAAAVTSGAKAAVDTGAKAGGSMLKWLIPVLLGLLALGYFGFKTGCSAVDNAAETVTDATTGAVEGAVDIAEGAAEKAGDAVDAVADALKSVALPGGKEISFAAGSFGNQIVDFLNGDELDYSKGFTFDGLNFATGSDALDKASNAQIENLAAILSAYPDYKVRIEGHTDNTGNADANKTLSANRAKSVKAALATAGVTANRIETAGFGSEKPVGDNATKEGKAANRRVDLYFLK